MRRYNGLTSSGVERARASYEAIGLCYECGMPKEKCLHVVLAEMMPDYAEFAATNPTYDQLRTKRQELMEARAERDKRGRDEAMRIDTGRLDWTPAHERQA